MAKVLLGFLLGLAVTTFAVTRDDKGGAYLTAQEVDAVEYNFGQLQYNFQMAIEHIYELNHRIEVLEKAKCT